MQCDSACHYKLKYTMLKQSNAKLKLFNILKQYFERKNGLQ